MRLSFFIFLVFLVTQTIFCNQGIRNYYTVESNNSLRISLHNLIDDHSVIPYSSSSQTDVLDALKSLFTDTNNSDNVILAYSRRSEPKDNLMMTDGWVAEHLWNKSYGIENQEPAYSDLFNLMPADWNVSLSRGNNYFDISDPLDLNYRTPGFDEAPLTSRDSDTWEPPDQIKGDVARAVLYMDLRYDGNASNETDLIITDDISLIASGSTRFGKLSTFLKWHLEDPVSEEELARNESIAANYQQNRNPFIDFPQLASAMHDSSNHPLVFLTASYYTNNVSWNVTGLVNDEVTNGTIRLDIGNHTMGGDPEFGEGKSFHALIAYEDKIYRMNLREGDEINIPHNLDSGGDSGDSGSGGVRSPNWNDTDLFHVKSYTQHDENGSDFRTFDFLLKSRDNFPNQVQTISLPFGASASSVNTDQFVKEGAHYIFERSFTSSAELLTNYPIGIYRWNIGNGDFSNRVEHTVNTAHADYPIITPQIIGGKWHDGVLLVDPGNPTIRITQWNGEDSKDRLEYGFWRNGGSGGGSSSVGRSSLDLSFFGLEEEHFAYIYYLKTVSESQSNDFSGDVYNSRHGIVSALYFKIKFDLNHDGNTSNSGELEIIEAIYGASGRSSDITGLLQSRVTNDQLSIRVSSSQLGGDPAFGEVKTLSVKYKYGAHTYRTTTSEYDTLVIPNPNHEKVEPTLSEVLADPARFGLVSIADINDTLAEKWEEGFVSGVDAVKNSPFSYQLFNQNDLNSTKQEALSIIESNRSKWFNTGILNVLESPSEFGLILRDDINSTINAARQNGYDGGLISGSNKVVKNPSLYNLYSEFDLNISKLEALSIIESNRSKWFDAGTFNVLESLSEFGLISKDDINSTINAVRKNGYDEGFVSGSKIVIENPSLYHLYSEFDLNASNRRSLSQGYLNGMNFVISNGLIDIDNHEQKISLHSADSNSTQYTSGWYFQPSRGWLYTNSSSFPYLYDSKTNNWLYFKAGHEIPLFYEYSSKEWIRINSDE